jgi:leucyl-tRNA synthetase
MLVNWCPSCKAVLANEEAKDGHCERCGTETVKREKPQWALKITEYAEQLITGLDTVDYLDRIKVGQINWIGKSEGAEVTFGTDNGGNFTVYTTRADTLFGATYSVFAPEHPTIKQWLDDGIITNSAEVAAYVKQTAAKSELTRTTDKDKTGVKLLGISAINPVTGKAIPIFISDYVLFGYGTGAIMAVPAHDDRDFEFATKFGAEIIQVVDNAEHNAYNGTAAFTDCETGVLINSGFLDGLSVDDALDKIKSWLEINNKGTRKINYKLRDWLFARQRYWGEPIPIVICDKCGYVPLPESELPLVLPHTDNFKPRDDGESPLASLTDWVNCKCPKCHGDAKRETDTMPQWAGSSWYYLRYCDPHNDNALIGKEALDYYAPVDWYNGGMEHTTLHLLYSRFWHKVLYDCDVVNTPEPYLKRTAHGMILGSDGQKMSKSRGNVVNPDDVIREYGADTMRLYEMFLGDFEKVVKWDNLAVVGCYRFLERVWKLADKFVDTPSPDTDNELNKTIKKVTDDIDAMKFNTAIAAMMTFINVAEKTGITKTQYEKLLIILHPFAPHAAEELYHEIYGGYVHNAKWAEYGEIKAADTIEIAVQLNGKIRAHLIVPSDLDKTDLTTFVKGQLPELFEGKTIVKEIGVRGKLANFAVR